MLTHPIQLIRIAYISFTLFCTIYIFGCFISTQDPLSSLSIQQIIISQSFSKLLTHLRLGRFLLLDAQKLDADFGHALAGKQ